MSAPRVGRDRAARVLAPLAVGAAALGIWQFLVAVVGISDYVLPSPTSILSQFGEFRDQILDSALITGWNALFGLVVGSLAGIAAATIAARWSPIDGMTAPIVAGIAVVPIVALAPVLNSMFGADSEFGRRTIAALAAFVPVFVNTRRGLSQTAVVHRELMEVYAATATQTFRTVTLPTAAPFVLTGLRIASSLSVISALVAEYFGGPRGGLGSFISTSAASSAYSRAWAYVLAGVVLGLTFFLISLLIERVVLRNAPGPG